MFCSADVHFLWNNIEQHKEHKGQLGGKEKIIFQNIFNTLIKRQTKLKLVILYFHLKEVQNRMFFCSDLFALFFWSRKGMLVFSIFPLPTERDPGKGKTEPSIPNVTT